jgi:hypothetical protein
MPERVVHVLEVVEVEAEQRKPAAPAALDVLQRHVDAVMEQGAVGKPCERVVVGQEADAGFDPPALGDVLVGRHPAAARHGPLGHGHRPPPFALFKEGPGAALRSQRLLLQPDALAQPRVVPAAGTGGAEQLGRGDPRPRHARAEPEELQEAGVAHDEPLRCVHHAQALRHVVERGVEAGVLRVQVVVTLLQDQVLELHLLHRLPGLLLRGGELAVHPLQEAVVPDQHAGQGEAAGDQADEQAGEDPVEPAELLQVAGCPVAAFRVRLGREPRELRIQPRQHRHESLRRVPLVERVHEGLRRGGDLLQLRDRRRELRVGLGERADLAAFQERDPVEDDVQPELGGAAFGLAAADRERADGRLEAGHLHDGLAQGPADVVARRFRQRRLPADDEDRGVDGRRQEDGGERHEPSLRHAQPAPCGQRPRGVASARQQPHRCHRTVHRTISCATCHADRL